MADFANFVQDEEITQGVSALGVEDDEKGRGTKSMVMPDLSNEK